MYNKINLFPLIILFLAIFLFQERAFAACVPERSNPIFVCNGDTVCKCQLYPGAGSDWETFYSSPPCAGLHCQSLLLDGHSAEGLCNIASSIISGDTPPNCPKGCQNGTARISTYSFIMEKEGDQKSCCKAHWVRECLYPEGGRK